MNNKKSFLNNLVIKIMKLKVMCAVGYTERRFNELTSFVKVKEKNICRYMH